MAHDQTTQITRLLNEVGRREGATDELLAAVYDQLHVIASARMRGERSDHTLQPTVLVHEAFVRLVGGDRITWEERSHFYRYAAEAMRRLLIDHARRKRSQKRGGTRRALPMSAVDLAADEDPGRVLALEEVLQVFEREEPRAAEIVKLRFFAGLGVEQAAEVMGVSVRTVMRESAYARARLVELLAERA